MNEEIIQNLNERLDRAIDKGRDIIEDEQFQQRVEEVKVQAEHTIREHPLLSVAAGVAVGFILARLFSSDE
ncbi:MAG: hypothetical protein JJ971_09185 [Balneolaceae bacterium]|nr:hypothetical protein [Balneolaceae bacterium]MBO6546583.1 hypothetical protein [Balneolaceae bacterium]MBO6648942.1 hypothetical protein [Balneolaceae bacterium]